METSVRDNSFPASFAEDDRPEIDYHSPHDDAWYAVELILIHDVLVVRYKDFPNDSDEVFPASDHFSSSGDIDLFAARFRPTFQQMQDSECPMVAKGTEVCALLRSDAGDVKFYDATIVQVDRTKHEYNEKQEEVCSCSFSLSWKTGPLIGKVTSAKIDDLCLCPEDTRLDPILLSFLKKAKDQLPEHAHTVLESFVSSGSPEHRPSSHAKGLLNPETSPHRHDQMKIKGSLNSKLSDAPQQQLLTDNLDFYSMQRARREGRFAVKTPIGSLHGM